MGLGHCEARYEIVLMIRFGFQWTGILSMAVGIDVIVTTQWEIESPSLGCFGGDPSATHRTDVSELSRTSGVIVCTERELKLARDRQKLRLSVTD